ncbi:hypothetical protein TNCV_2413491 [Trichonephila clavipes]|nr:hypothetical protein TNCV_2413491 [Trichonephila clavipes]
MKDIQIGMSAYADSSLSEMGSFLSEYRVTSTADFSPYHNTSYESSVNSTGIQSRHSAPHFLRTARVSWSQYWPMCRLTTHMKPILDCLV